MPNNEDARQVERRGLLETLRDVGPDAPTLCSQWSAADVAAHLLLSEQYRGVPVVLANALRRVLPATTTRRAIDAFQPVNERLIRRARRRGWSHLVQRLEAGPPPAFYRGTIKHLRLVEEWIHHEDIRRANGQAPREGSDCLDDQLWKAALVISRFPEFVPGREGIEMQLPDGRSHSLTGRRDVRVRGRAGELLLYLAGRTEFAQVTVDGDPAAIAATSTALSV